MVKKEKDAARDEALRKSYGAAEKRLREAHPDEFNQYRVEEAAALGVTWTPPLTPQQKAQAEIARLYAEFPALDPYPADA